MSFYNKQNKGRVFFKFLISYILVLLIPFMISILAYIEAVKIVDKNATRYNMSMLYQSMNVIEQRLDEINSLVIQLGLNTKVNSLINISKINEGSSYIYYLWLLQKEMAPYLISNNFISDFLIYYKGSDIIVSRDKVYTKSSLFYGYFYKYADMSLDQWKSGILDQYHYKNYLGSQKVETNKASYSVITYLQSLPLEYPRENKGVIMVNIDEEKIRKLLEPINIGTGGWAYISDRNNNIISTYAHDRSRIQTVEITPEENSGFFHQKIDGEDMIVSYATMQSNGWKFVSAVPTSEVMNEVGYIKTIIYIIMVLSLLLGIIAAYLLANKNSKPINKLVNALREIVENGPKQIKNEYDFLQGSVYELINNNNKLKSLMSEQSALLKLTFFDRLLKGDFNNRSQIEVMLSHINLKIEGNKFCVVIMKINDHNKGASREELQKLDVIRLIIKDVLSRQASQCGFLHEIDENKIALLLYADEQNIKTFEVQVRKVAADSQKELLDSYGINTFCAAGSIYDNIIDVSHSFNEAKLALDYYVVNEAADLVWFKDIAKRNEGYYYPIYMELRIINTIKAGDMEAAESLLNSIYNENFTKRKLSLALLQQVIYELRGTVTKLLDQINLKFPVENMPSQIRTVEEAAETYKTIIHTFKLICASINNQKNDNLENVKNEITKYIEANYMKCTLCLSEVAEKFRYSESSLYHLFKNATNMTFSDYLESVRISQACKLLSETGFSIKDITEMVGYNNDTTFRRAFKRNQGMGPMEYRSEYQIK